MKTKILIGAGAALLLLLNVVAFSSFGREPEPTIDFRLAHCYQTFAGCNYMPGYNGYCTERTTASHCTRDYVYCSQCIPFDGFLPDDPRGDDDISPFPYSLDPRSYPGDVNVAEGPVPAGVSGLDQKHP